jgi:hypothetical protein|tara:strand:+ start:140 stop:382 length:243 start_codon:yes stop_codon:yes gene_type:complete
MAGIKFVHRDEKEVKLTSTPKVDFNKSKKLSSMSGGNSLYYIDVEEAFKLKLDSFCDFTQKHPQNENYTLITIPIQREEK